MVKFLQSRGVIAMLAFICLLPSQGFAEKVRESPSATKMTMDVLLARPIGLGIVGIGTVVYVATLPFSLLGGNAKDAGRTLVLDPAEEVFVRCLGCSTSGRQKDVNTN